MVEPNPYATVWRPLRLHGDASERQGCGRAAKASGVIVIFDHRPDMGARRASRQNSLVFAGRLKSRCGRRAIKLGMAGGHSSPLNPYIPRKAVYPYVLKRR
jgi:hypothetical protein